MSERYKLFVDDKLVWSSNHIKVLKDKAQYEFDYGNAYFAKIMVGKRIYAARFYNTRWK